MLLDINLPDGNGLNFCRETRDRGLSSYTIFLTANDQKNDMPKGYEAGGADYMTKPFSIIVLYPFIWNEYKKQEPECNVIWPETVIFM